MTHKGVDNIDLATNVNRRTIVSPPPARIDHHRGLPGTYEVDAFGYSMPNNPIARWNATPIIRFTTPVQNWPPNMPIYDPTTMGPPNYWNRPPNLG